MEKIELVLERICKNPDRIKDVTDDGGELYFRYLNHTFSILHRIHSTEVQGDYSFYVYPDWTGTLNALARAKEDGYFQEGGGKMMGFHSAQLGKKQMAELYSVVLAKLYNIDKIFDEILDEPDPF
jgi:hypothetical protein